MRLVRALWGLLALTLLLTGGVTWWLTRPEPPEPPWAGAVSVLTGDGNRGWRDGPAHQARLSEPFGLAATADGVLYVSDAGSSHRIGRIAADGTLSTLAGGTRGFADGRGAEARFATPSHIVLAPDGSLVVADTGNHAIRRVSPDGVVTTIAGDGVAGLVDGAAERARFRAPVGVAVAPDGRIIVADTYNDRIRQIDPAGQVRTLAGGDGPGLVDGSALEARFDTPCAVAVAPDGRVFVADTGNGVIRVIARDGTVASVPMPPVALDRPMGLALDARGDLFVGDEAGRVSLLPAVGEARLLAGQSPGFSDGAGRDARFRRPAGLAVLATGPTARVSLAVADAGNALVRLVTPTLAGSPDCGSGGRCGVLPTPTVRGRWPWTPPDLHAPAPPLRTPAFDEDAFARTPLLWPIGTLEGPHEVAGTFAEARGEAGMERFHAGLDIREPVGTPVRAVRDDIVSSPISAFGFDTLNEGVRIGDLAYIHIRVGRGVGPVDPQRFAPVSDATGVMSRMRAMRGAAFAAGDAVGSVNRFNHVHLNVGWSGEEINPLHFRLVRFEDTIAPTIAPAGVRLFDEAGQPLNPDRLVPVPGARRGRPRPPRRLPPIEPIPIQGRVRIVVDAWDRAEGNTPSRRLGLYALGYQVLHTGGRPVAGYEAPLMTLLFDRMPQDRDTPRQVYAGGSGIPVYGSRRTQFLYVVTTKYRDGVATPGAWDTSALVPGEYVLRVFARDFHGNVTTRDLRVTVGT